MAGWYALVLLAFALMVMSSPAESADGACDGLGFGCSPNPRDNLLLLGMILGAPLLAASAVVSVITLSVALSRGARSGAATGTFAALAGVAVIMCAVCALASAVPG